MKLESASIDDLSRVLASRELSATELTTHFLNRIDARSDLNAFISVEHDLALESAAEADRRLRAGDQAPLLGIPIAEKDLLHNGWINNRCFQNARQLSLSLRLNSLIKLEAGGRR